MCTDALKAVPRLVGQEVIYPKWSSWANLATVSIWAHAFESLVNTAPISAPFYIEIILN